MKSQNGEILLLRQVGAAARAKSGLRNASFRRLYLQSSIAKCRVSGKALTKRLPFCCDLLALLCDPAGGRGAVLSGVSVKCTGCLPPLETNGYCWHAIRPEPGGLAEDSRRRAIQRNRVASNSCHFNFTMDGSQKLAEDIRSVSRPKDRRPPILP